MATGNLIRGYADVHMGADVGEEARLFGQALERYRRLRRRPFPTASEVLAVAVSLGYRRVAEPGPLPCCVGSRNDPPPLRGV